MHESAGATASSELDAYCLSETLPQTSTADQSNDQLTPLPPPPPPASPSDHGEDDDEEEEEEVFASASDEVIIEAAAAGTTPPVSPILPAASTPAVRLAGRAQRTAATAASPATVSSKTTHCFLEVMHQRIPDDYIDYIGSTGTFKDECRHNPGHEDGRQRRQILHRQLEQVSAFISNIYPFEIVNCFSLNLV